MLPAPLIEILRRWLRGDAPGHAPRGISQVAGLHRLNGTLYHIGPRLSDLDAEICERTWRQSLGAHLMRRRALSEHWPAELPAPLVFKGGDLIEHLYDDPGARECTDLDLLIPMPWYATARARLAARASEVRRAHQPRRLAGELVFSEGYVLDGVLIELHQSPLPAYLLRMDVEALWRRGVLEEGLRYPLPEDRLALWLANQTKTAFDTDLADLTDLALILRALRPLPGRVLRERLGEMGLGVPWSVALVLLESSGLWPFEPLPSSDLRGRITARFLPRATAPKSPHAAGFGNLFQKLLLPSIDRYPAILQRVAANLLRRGR